MKKSCTIIISHYESESFLHTCIRQTRKMAHPEIRQHIIISDQSCEETANRLNIRYGSSEDVTIVRTIPLYSGFGLDYIFRNIPIDTDYVCQLHCDAFGISNQYIMLAIKLIEENDFSFVGQLQFICDGTQSIYPPNSFSAMAQCYNIAKTSTYVEMSMQAGFTRFHNRKDSGLEFKNNEWAEWAAVDYNGRGSDDDTVAFSWESKFKNTDKLGLLTTSFTKSNFGRIIENIVFHFCSCRESIGVEEHMGDQYNMYYKKIKEDYSDELVEELISLSKQNPINADYPSILARNFWDGKLKQSFPPTEALNKRIEELKNI